MRSETPTRRIFLSIGLLSLGIAGLLVFLPPASGGGPPARGVFVSDLGWNDPEDEDVAAWLHARHPGLQIDQVTDPNKEPTGILRKGDLTRDLGETPFRYHVQVLTAAGPMLLGEKDNRHKIERSVSMVREVDGVLQIDRVVTVTHSNKAANYGVVFKRGKLVVDAVGVIIPDITVPEGRNPWDFQVEVRCGSRFLSYPNDGAMDLPVLRAEHDGVVVLGATSDVPDVIHVLWFEFDESGSLVPSGRHD